MFVYQLTSSAINSTGTNTISSWESKGVYVTDLVPIKNDSLPKIKYLKDRNRNTIQLYPFSCTSDQSNNKYCKFYMVYDLDNWPRNPPRNFSIKNCLFGVTNIVKNDDKEKYVYSGYRIAFDGKGEQSFNNYTGRNVIIFGVDDSSSAHTDNRKNDFLILGEGTTLGFNGNFGVSAKKLQY